MVGQVTAAQQEQEPAVKATTADWAAPAQAVTNQVAVVAEQAQWAVIPQEPATRVVLAVQVYNMPSAASVLSMLLAVVVVQAALALAQVVLVAAAWVVLAATPMATAAMAQHTPAAVVAAWPGAAHWAAMAHLAW